MVDGGGPARAEDLPEDLREPPSLLGRSQLGTIGTCPGGQQLVPIRSQCLLVQCSDDGLPVLGFVSIRSHVLRSASQERYRCDEPNTPLKEPIGQGSDERAALAASGSWARTRDLSLAVAIELLITVMSRSTAIRFRECFQFDEVENVIVRGSGFPSAAVEHAHQNDDATILKPLGLRRWRIVLEHTGGGEHHSPRHPRRLVPPFAGIDA